ncbi:hypothetical protein F4859DRAFT_524102 [Xylaria cf. heliscus]|nr:hypothetical protein F4859DRAFT_524102 [Xylaria cf. heliscus]
MAPKYQLYSGFGVKDALAVAGAPGYKSAFQEGEPPVAFFAQPPESAAAVFSTVFGTRPFRLVENPTPEREGHYWWAAEIQRVCDELRRNLPDVCRKIETPRSYLDLYKYFDAYDIYYRGAQNLWNVINTFVFENEYAQKLVDDEQKMQTEKYMPLFEYLASEIVRKPEIQTKLLGWDREKPNDVLKFLTAYELRIFEGYEKYPPHFVDAIRDIFIRRHYNLRRGSSAVDPCLAPIDGEMPNKAILEDMDGLRQYLQYIETLDDPFMDKFEIPNKIINGIVIADGTSKTAALKAKNEGTIPSNKPTHRPVIQDNNIHEPPQKWTLTEDINIFSQESSDTTHPVSTTERCSSAPSIGGDPANILRDTVTKEARVYPGDGHEVDKKLMGCPKPPGLMSTSDDTPEVADAIHIAMPAPDSHLQQVSTNMNQNLPHNHYHYVQYQGSRRPSSPTRPPMFAPVPNSAPVPVPSYRISGTRDRGMSQGLFAYQIPPYTIRQQHMQGPPPTTQQTQYPRPAHIPHNEGDYPVHAVPPHFQAEPRQQQTAPPPFTDGPESLRQHKRNSSTRNHGTGKWQHIGSDDIHGPKVIFRKGSIHDREDQSRRASQWQSKESNRPDRRTSTASNYGNYHQLNNPRPQQYIAHTGPRQTAGNFATTGRGPRTSTASGHSWSESMCVNANRHISVHTKFDPCPCNRCSDRDRSIFVSRLKEGINQTDSALERLKQHFSKFGQVDSVAPVSHNTNCVHVKFASPHMAVAAVRSEPEVQIDDLGENPFRVQFRTGSQFFTPHRLRNFAYDAENRDHLIQNAAVTIPQPFGIHVKDWRHSSPEQQVISPGNVAPRGQYPGANLYASSKHTTNPTDQTGSQSGSGTEMIERLSYSEMTSPMITPHPIHGLVVVDAKDTHGMTKHQREHSSQFGRILSGGNTQEWVGNIAEPPHVTSPRQASRHGTPGKTVQSDHNPPRTIIASSNSQDSLARVPKNGDSAKPEEEASIDYGTVRIRPGKARYMAIPPAWRQETTSPGSEQMTASRYLEVVSQCGLTPITKATIPLMPPFVENIQETETMERSLEDVTAPPHHETGGDKMSAEDEHLSGHHDPSFHVKRKASETDGDEKAPGQPSPKKKFSKAIQPPSSLSRHQDSQSGFQQHKQQAGGTGKTKTGKKKKNKNRQKQDTQQAIPGDDSAAAAPFEAQTFKPAIAASHLPPYPQQHVLGHAARVSETIHRREAPQIMEPVYVRIPPTPPRPSNRFDESEPFPAYRDLMCGPQIGHRSRASGTGLNRSISSNASTIVHLQDFGPNSYRMNPGAQNFIPGHSTTNNRQSTMAFNSQPSVVPNPCEGNHAFRSPDRSIWGTRDIGRQEAPQPHMQTGIERSNSNMPTFNQPTAQKPAPSQSPNCKKTEGNKREIESANSKGDMVPKTTAKENNNGSKANTGAKQGGGKGKGKSKNAKAGRNDQKNTAQPPADRKGELSKSDGSKGTSPKKPGAAVKRKPEVLKKQDIPADAATATTTKQHLVVVPRENEPEHGEAKDRNKADHESEKGKGKKASPPPPEEKKTAVKGVVETAVEVKTKKAQNKDNVDDDKTPTTRPEPRAAVAGDPPTNNNNNNNNNPSATETATGATTPAKPKQPGGKAESTQPRTGTLQPPIARPTMPGITGTGKPELATKNPEGVELSPPKPKPKPRPMLAPIPLFPPGTTWRTMLGRKKGVGVGVEDEKVGEGEALPPNGERKGG